jgi:hypothetical protein
MRAINHGLIFFNTKTDNKTDIKHIAGFIKMTRITFNKLYNPF